MTPKQKEMVDERVCAILRSLMERGSPRSLEDGLADEWACLQVAAGLIAPIYGLNPRNEDLLVRLQRAAHRALKAECSRYAIEQPPTPLDPRD
jgi:hypothetical protein